MMYQRNKVEKICIECEEPFEAKIATQIYCSMKCSRKHHYHKNKKN